MTPVPLTEPWFDAQFYGHVTTTGFRRLPSMDGGQGLILWCPCGYGQPQYPLDSGRPHALLVPFADRGLPDEHGPVSSSHTHPRWKVSGAGLHDLTASPSIDVGCWHGFIANGLIRKEL